MKKKLLSLLLVGSMVLSLAACGDEASAPASSDAAPATEEAAEATTEEAAEETAAIDLSERVDLVFYVMGDAPADEQVVEDALNEVLLEKANATIDFQFSTWTDYGQKYNMTLTSGGADLIYTANWLNFGQLANSGAFLELNDLLDTYAPELKELVGEAALNQCAIDGEAYAVPNAWPEYTSPGVKYREDLREKYDLPVPNSIENMEAYLLGIKENEPTQTLLSCTTEEAQTTTKIAFDAAEVLNFKYPWVSKNGLDYGLAANYDTPTDVYDYWFSDDFVEDMKILKKWSDYGFWSKSALSGSSGDGAEFEDGGWVAEVCGVNPSKYNTTALTLEKNGDGYKAGYVAYGEVNGVIFPAHAQQNATSIPRDCKNPERAIYVLQLLMCDEEVNKLVQYGIEGTHYEIDENGYYVNLSDNFGYEGFATWNLRNGDIKLAAETDAVMNEVFERLEPIGEATKWHNVDIYSGFIEDYEAYSAERTAVVQVMSQYLAPIQAGLVDDVEAAIEDFRTRVKDAGIDTVREQYTAQWVAYCEANGYVD